MNRPKDVQWCACGSSYCAREVNHARGTGRCRRDEKFDATDDAGSPPSHGPKNDEQTQEKR